MFKVWGCVHSDMIILVNNLPIQVMSRVLRMILPQNLQLCQCKVQGVLLDSLGRANNMKECVCKNIGVAVVNLDCQHGTTVNKDKCPKIV